MSETTMNQGTETPVFTIREENRFKLDPNFVVQFIGQQPKWGFGLLSYVTYKRTYARRIDKDQLAREAREYLGLSTEASVRHAASATQESEEYWQTCVRVVEGVSSIYKQFIKDSGQNWSDAVEQEHAQAMFQRMWDLKFTPPGRGLWGMGTSAMELKGSAMLNNCGFCSTQHLATDFTSPFERLMDFSMLGVGMGFDVLGAGTVTLREPEIDYTPFTIPDTREGWVHAVKLTLGAFVGYNALPREWDYSQIRPEGAPLRTFGGTASGYGPLKRLLDTLYAICRSYVGRFIDDAFIVDVMNIIGVCVVAGNVRRSSEIALGSPKSESFLRLKDSTKVRELSTKITEVAKTIPGFKELADDYFALYQQTETMSAVDPRRVAAQQDLMGISARMKALAATNPEHVALEAELYAQPLYTHRWASNNTVLCEIGNTDYDAMAEQTLLNGEPGYGWLEVIRQYGRLKDPPNNKDRKAMGFNPCGEQSLHDGELCCLVESYPTRHETLEDFLETLKYAYRYAKAVTLIPTHDKKTNAVMVRNRRIGTSMAGIIEMYSKLGMRECKRWWDEGYKTICEWDTEYSAWLGVNESIKKTSLKPGGTTPLLVGVEGGMKAPTSAYYMRTIRIDHISPLLKPLRDAGYRMEPDLTTPRTMVVYFPVKAPTGVRSGKEISLWEQAEIFTALQSEWSDNMVSATLTFQDSERGDVARVLKNYEGRWKGVSFLPFSDHGFAQAPYIPCSKTEYENAVAALSPVTLDGNLIAHDTDDKYCSGGLCETPVPSPELDAIAS